MEPNIICGCYLIATITCDINDERIHYWIKVGKSSGVKSRIKTYYTYNPGIQALDFRAAHWEKMHELEYKCHKKLSNVCIRVASNTHEWFEVVADDFYKIKEFGFKYFD